MRPREAFDTIYTRRPEGWGFSERRTQAFRYEIYLELLSRIAPPKSILDLGCGEGLFSAMLKERFASHVVGIDVSHVAVQRARERHPKIHFHEGSVTAIPWQDLGACQRPDVVIAGEVLYYLEPEEQRACIRDIRSAMEPGRYILTSVNIGPPPYFTRKQLNDLFDGFVRVADRSIHLRSYYKHVETHLWDLRCRVPGVGGKILSLPLRYAPIRFIDALSRRFSDMEESIYIALYERADA